jgi:hypothetical protein
MILSKCFKCGGDRVLISNSMQRPDYASHTEDECLIALNSRISVLEEAALKYNHDHISTAVPSGS